MRSAQFSFGIEKGGPSHQTSAGVNQKRFFPSRPEHRKNGIKNGSKTVKNGHILRRKNILQHTITHDPVKTKPCAVWPRMCGVSGCRRSISDHIGSLRLAKDLAKTSRSKKIKKTRLKTRTERDNAKMTLQTTAKNILKEIIYELPIYITLSNDIE